MVTAAPSPTGLTVLIPPEAPPWNALENSLANRPIVSSLQMRKPGSGWGVSLSFVQSHRWEQQIQDSAFIFCAFKYKNFTVSFFFPTLPPFLSLFLFGSFPATHRIDQVLFIPSCPSAGLEIPYSTLFLFLFFIYFYLFIFNFV